MMDLSLQLPEKIEKLKYELVLYYLILNIFGIWSDGLTKQDI